MTNHSIAIRPFQTSDREILRTLTIEAFVGVSIDHAIEQVLGPVGTGDWRIRKGKHVDEDIDALDGEVAVAEMAGEPVGYVSMRFDREARVGRIPNVVVAAGLRGQGLGRRLLEHALDRFRSEGMVLAKIETLAHNPVGGHLYPSVGFVEVTRQIHFAMKLDPIDSIPPVSSSDGNPRS